MHSASAWKKLIVALDLDKEKEIKKIVKILAPRGVKFKIGYRAFIKFGPSLVKDLVRRNVDVFLDLKLHDIPNTMKQAAAVIADLGVWAFTVHIAAEAEAISAVKKEVAAVTGKNKKRKPLILGVSVLTSQACSKKEVTRRVGLAAQCGLDGVIASAREAALIKKRHKGLKVITPGIRPPHAASGDQKRVATAAYAFKNQADYIVVGRPIVQAKDPFSAAQAVLRG